ncbi:hypothetical protein GWO13_00815, partial [Candidatus Bathyarchaeota archaeon]|nr:hypothetical protein [Candidatus Bathyarchaeota archaeon]
MRPTVEFRYNQLKALLTKARYTLISAFLGWLGSINIILIGIHVTTLYLHLAVLSGSFLTRVYTVGGIATASTLTLFFGSYLICRGEGGKGGVLNLAGGIATLVL